MAQNIHNLAIVDSQNVGEDTQVWEYVHILSGARIGKNCNINSHCFIENDVVIGNNVTIKCGVYLWDGIRIADDVFVGPNATFTNDRFPRSMKQPEKFIQTHLLEGCSIGAHVSILGGVTIGKYAMVGMGSVVLKDVEDYGLVYGNPASKKGYVCSCGKQLRSIDKEFYECICDLNYRTKNGVLSPQN